MVPVLLFFLSARQKSRRQPHDDAGGGLVANATAVSGSDPDKLWKLPIDPIIA